MKILYKEIQSKDYVEPELYEHFEDDLPIHEKILNPDSYSCIEMDENDRVLNFYSLSNTFQPTNYDWKTQKDSGNHKKVLVVYGIAHQISSDELSFEQLLSLFQSKSKLIDEFISSIKDSFTEV